MKTFVDIIIVSIYNNKLSVLLGKRANNVEVFAGEWTLPGGRYEEAFTPDQAASQQLYKNFGIQVSHLDQVKTFGGPNRDPRGSSLSISYLALVNYKKINNLKSQKFEEIKWFPIDELPFLAFDHAEMIRVAHERIVRQIRYTKIGFELIGDEFTMNEVVSIFSNIIGEKIDQSNLRKKLLELDVIYPTRLVVSREKGEIGRPSPIFKLNRKSLENLPITASFFKKEK